MTATTPLSMLKAHLNISDSIDDTLLQHKLDAAELWIAKYTGAAFPTSPEAPLTEAALQLAACWYEQREASSELNIRPVPFGVRELLSPYRDQVTGHVVAQ